MRLSRNPYTWGREHPLVVDALLALLVTVLGVLSELAPGDPAQDFSDATSLSLVLTLTATLPLVLRRRRPVVVYLVALGAVVVHGAGGYSSFGPLLAMVLGLYAVAAYSPRRTAFYCLVGAVALMSLVTVTEFEELELAEMVGLYAVVVLAWVLGDSMRVRRDYIEAMEQRAAHLEREQDAQAQQAVVEERARIARELHDIVAHNMSVMVVQAGAARRSLDRRPGAAAEAIGQIEETGRGALDEMRRLVGVLRRAEDQVPDGADGEPLGPQPDIDDVPTLIAQCREAGLDVSYQVHGSPRQVPSGMGLVVYRIIQEALTNTMKHAGPAVHADVDLVYGRRVLAMRVVDDGRGAAAPIGAAGVRRGSHGLTGMAERVMLYSGKIRSGPRRGGGFSVSVSLPLVKAERDG